MNWIDRIAAGFGYVRAETQQPHTQQPLVVADPTSPLPTGDSSPWLPVPSDFGFPSDVTFDVFRGGNLGTQPVDWTAALDFLDACGIDLNGPSTEMTLAAILAGVPIHIDGADMVFKPRL